MTIASLLLVPPGFPAESDVDAVIYELGGDPRIIGRSRRPSVGRRIGDVQ